MGPTSGDPECSAQAHHPGLPLVGPADHHVNMGPQVVTPIAAPELAIQELHLWALLKVGVRTFESWQATLKSANSNVQKLTVNFRKLEIQLVQVDTSTTKVDRLIFAKTARHLPTRHRGLVRHCVFRRWLRWEVEGRPPQGPPRDLPPQPRRKARRGKQPADHSLRQPNANATRE